MFKNKSFKPVIKKVKKKVTHFFLRIYSRHPSVDALRRTILIKGKKAIYRHGSTTAGDIKYEINSVSAVRKSADKLLMKKAFDDAKISHATWLHLEVYKTNKASFDNFLKALEFPKKKLIIKHRFGSRGGGNYLISDKAGLDKFIKERMGSLASYIVEEYKTYSVEYRIHVTSDGHFYTCRKVLKNDTPKEKRFQRHDDNCSWLIETNPKFDKPNNWVDIVKDCVKATAAIGADVLAFDVKCTSKKKSKDGKVSWILLESCSAPAFGEKMTEEYKKILPKIIEKKYNL